MKFDELSLRFISYDDILNIAEKELSGNIWYSSSLESFITIQICNGQSLPVDLSTNFLKNPSFIV